MDRCRGVVNALEGRGMDYLVAVEFTDLGHTLDGAGYDVIRT